MDQVIDRRYALQVIAASGVACLLPRPAEAAVRPVLLELFTSQGCSSCPPADRLAAEFVNDPNVIVVSYHVDYWDYLGWKDTLAQEAFTKRQRDYAKARGDGDIYTPQAVINGQFHAVGSSRPKVEAAIAKARAPAVEVPLAIRFSGDDVSVESKGSAFDGEATLWLLSVTDRVSVTIDRGENAGSTVDYHRVVRSLTPLGMYKGNDAVFTLPTSAVLAEGTHSVLAILQKDMAGPVIALAQADIPGA